MPAAALLAAGTSAFSDLLPALVAVVGVLLGLATTVGVILAARVSKSTQTLANYKDAAESASTLASSLRAELDELKIQHAADLDRAHELESGYEKEIAGLKARVAMLQELATGQTALEKLTQQAQQNAAGISQILAIVSKRQETPA